MKPKKRIQTVALVIGIIFLASIIIVFLQGGPPKYASIPSKIKSQTFSILTSDQFLAPLGLPLAIGLDIITWTIGVIIWLFGYGSWPGEALGIFLVAHPVIYYVFEIIFCFLGLFVMIVLPYWIFSAIRKAMNTKHYLDWGSSIVGTIALFMGIYILAQLVSSRGISFAILSIAVGTSALATGILLPLKYKTLAFNIVAGIMGILFGIVLLLGTFHAISLDVGSIPFSIWFIVYAVRGLLQARVYKSTSPSQYIVLRVLNFLLVVFSLLGTVIPFFTLTGWHLVVAIALITESLITWLE